MFDDDITKGSGDSQEGTGDSKGGLGGGSGETPRTIRFIPIPVKYDKSSGSSVEADSSGEVQEESDPLFESSSSGEDISSVSESVSKSVFEGNIEDSQGPVFFSIFGKKESQVVQKPKHEEKGVEFSKPPQLPESSASVEAEDSAGFEGSGNSDPALLEGLVPFLEDVSPELPAKVGKAVVDPEFDNLPGLESQGSKLGLWSLVLGALGVIVAFISFGGGLNFKLSLGLGLIGCVLAVVSFFQKPKVWKSVVGLLVCLILAGGSVVGILVHSGVSAAGNLVKEVEKEVEKEGFNPAALGLPDSVVRDMNRVMEEGVSSQEGSASQEENPFDAAVPADSAVQAEGLEGEQDEESLVLLPPELRPEVEEESPYGDPGVLLPPENRLPDIVVRSDKEIIGNFWLEVEKGLAPGASLSYRQLFDRVAEVVGYPPSVFAEFSPELRLYVLTREVLSSGVDLSDFREISTVSDVGYTPYDVVGDSSPGALLGPGDPSSIPLDEVGRILSSRGYGTLSDGVGKFMGGVTQLQVRDLLDETVSSGVFWEEPSGKRVYDARFSRQVGWDSSGMASTQVRVVFDSEGKLEDAYPY